MITLPGSVRAFKSRCDITPVATPTISHCHQAKMKGLISPLPRSPTNSPAAGRALNRPFLRDHHQSLKKTSVQRVPAEAAAQPEYSLWHLQKEFTRFSRAEAVAPAPLPFLTHGSIRSPSGINAREQARQLPPIPVCVPAAATATAPASAPRIQATGDRWHREPKSAAPRNQPGSEGCRGMLPEGSLCSAQQHR